MYKKNVQGKKDQKKKEKEAANQSGGGDTAEDEGVVVLEESESGEEPMEEGGGANVNGGQEGDVVEISDTSEDWKYNDSSAENKILIMGWC